MSRLDDRDGFANIARNHSRQVSQSQPSEWDWREARPQGREPDEWRLLGEIYCSVCGELRKVAIQARSLPPFWGEEPPSETLDGPAAAPIILPANTALGLVPALILVKCAQCETRHTLVSFEGPTGPDVILLPARPGKGGTPNTPAAVAYYVDQAERSKRVGARSAALAMYRAALESLLHHQGFTQNNLRDKLKALRAEKGSEAPRAWVVDVDDVAIEMLKGLGDGALHPNTGDISAQAAIDGDLLQRVELVVSALLHSVYEAGAAHAAARSRMQEALRELRGREARE